MKKISLQKLLVIITTTCVILMVLCSCNSSERIKYYSQTGNYISITGTVSSVKYSKDYKVLYIDLSESSPVLDDTCFKIVGENLTIVQTNGIDDKLKLGEQVTITTAPKYFGDGYVMPIVAISIGGEKLLDFNEGYNNFLDWLSK